MHPGEISLERHRQEEVTGSCSKTIFIPTPQLPNSPMSNQSQEPPFKPSASNSAFRTKLLKLAYRDKRQDLFKPHQFLSKQSLHRRNHQEDQTKASPLQHTFEIHVPLHDNALRHIINRLPLICIRNQHLPRDIPLGDNLFPRNPRNTSHDIFILLRIIRSSSCPRSRSSSSSSKGIRPRIT